MASDETRSPVRAAASRVLLLEFGFAQLHIVRHRAQAHLDAVQPDLPGHVEGSRVAHPADGPIAGPDREAALGRGGEQRGEGEAKASEAAAWVDRRSIARRDKGDSKAVIPGLLPTFGPKVQDFRTAAPLGGSRVYGPGQCAARKPGLC